MTYYIRHMSLKDKPLAWLHGKVKNTAFLKGSKARSRIPVSIITTRRINWNASFPANACDRITLSRTSYY